LAGGVRAGKYGRKDMEQGAKSDIDAARQDVVKGVGQLTKHSLGIAKVVKAVAKELGATPSQVALSWLLTRPGVPAPIIGARKIEQLQDNLGCLSVELSAEHLQRLNTSSQPEPIFPNNFGATEMFRNADDGESRIEGGFVEIYRGF
jgi:aryl-alcohol dehydrogenase-like predicted oxidoreductase